LYKFYKEEHLDKGNMLIRKNTNISRLTGKWFKLIKGSETIKKIEAN
jgi:hypothetical protein